MFNSILVPLDGSALATCVLPHVVAMTQALGSNLTLLHVLEEDNTPGDTINPVDWQLHKAEAQSYLNALGVRMDEQMGRFPSWQLREGPAAREIIAYAQKYEFDLVVLSSHGRSGLNGSNIGGVVQKVIERARKSILLVRAYTPVPDYAEEQWSAFRYRRILVPLDGSQRAEFVLPLVTALAHQYQAEILLVHILAKPEMGRRLPLGLEDSVLLEQMMESNRDQAHYDFATLQARLPLVSQLNIQSSANVATTLHDLAEQENADLVVLSAHGHSGQPQWPYGSIAASFITHGTTPLLIMQDLLPHEILQSKAERISADAHPQWHTNLKLDPERWSEYMKLR